MESLITILGAAGTAVAIIISVLTFISARKGHKANEAKVDAEVVVLRAEAEQTQAETVDLIATSESNLTTYYRQESERLLVEVKAARAEILALQNMVGSMANTITQLMAQLQTARDEARDRPAA